ncbi:Uncharacterised protein [Mycobacteroides abscessus subsp. abscessus]|nr:Uncharacterised protein [Mycobacteroides abscessus subsp. abscessus]SIG34946.1 Uncharacterised protein [Mycobacteroides abscessus subsp. abscessus]SIG51639.1 Uncharacterised protein [Mycobacteroides abscessus subsp. abscessus]SIG82058.1 Uncharacterised protein [Mycobacteroides abscessus subsp. abscessus]
MTAAQHAKRAAFPDLVRAVASSSTRGALARYALHIAELQGLGLVWVEKDTNNRRYVGATPAGVNALARLHAYERSR